MAKITKKKLPIEIVCIVDRSGSMSNIHADVIGGINTFITEQQKVKGKANLTLVEFDNEYNVLEKRVDLKKFKEITKDYFAPRGMTALNDAIGKTVAEFSELKKKNEIDKAIFCIMTDGGENSSLEFKSKDSIKALVEKAQKDFGWEFIYLAANQDAFAEGSSYGIVNNVNYAANSAGVGSVIRNFTASTTTYRANNT